MLFLRSIQRLPDEIYVFALHVLLNRFVNHHHLPALCDTTPTEYFEQHHFAHNADMWRLKCH